MHSYNAGNMAQQSLPDDRKSSDYEVCFIREYALPHARCMAEFIPDSSYVVWVI